MVQFSPCLPKIIPLPRAGMEWGDLQRLGQERDHIWFSYRYEFFYDLEHATRDSIAHNREQSYTI